MKVTARVGRAIESLQKAWLKYKSTPTPHNKWGYQSAWNEVQYALLDQFDRETPKEVSKQTPRCSFASAPNDRCLLPATHYHHDARGCRDLCPTHFERAKTTWRHMPGHSKDCRGPQA